MKVELLIDKLMDFYGISSHIELSEKLGISQPALSKWKTRNSINAIKKKCRELGIYNEIFGDLDLSEASESGNIVINDILLEKANEEAEKFGLDINAYIEYLIIQDLKK